MSDAVGGRAHGTDGGVDMWSVASGVEDLGYLIEVAARPAELAASGEEFSDHFALGGDLGSGALKVVGGGKRSAR
nr:hypothetical protein [Streptomyces phyllanthi]